ncbi:ferritin-like domain-containing protein [Paenibacillus cremeus]|uniref:Ferritin-like domain-containing protein n=1 Tax=Paenibacillus cremeus TaxID=2163881 RepID=A0A559KI78_9BACL|nr:ferritin-like domain-containing protein [Paenibacillus cremeus]TVY11843.1 ferritin-like domain-containing protein [Paenibacillus cremeus]
MDLNALHASERLSDPGKLKYQDVRRFLEQLQWSLNHIAGAVRTYATLAKLAPEGEAADEVERMLRQEKKHFDLVHALYLELKGTEPVVTPEAPWFETFREGLQQAIRMEREAMHQYRDTYLLTPSPRVRDLFFLVMSDGVDQLAALFLMQQSLLLS